MIESTVKVTFAATYIPELDTLYTYKTNDYLEEGQVAWIASANGPKKAQVIVVDKEYDLEAEKRFGELSLVYQRRRDAI